MAGTMDLNLLRERLDYEPLTGLFRWKPHPSMPDRWNTRFAGKLAGTWTKGRLVIRFGYAKHFAHRLAWYHVTGEWPAAEVDHANCDPADNRFENLRPATRGQNCANTRLPKHNRSGFKGVTWDTARQRWLAFTYMGGKFKNLGRFESKAEAAEAYLRHASSVYGSFARSA